MQLPKILSRVRLYFEDFSSEKRVLRSVKLCDSSRGTECSTRSGNHSEFDYYVFLVWRNCNKTFLEQIVASIFSNLF